MDHNLFISNFKKSHKKLFITKLFIFLILLLGISLLIEENTIINFPEKRQIKETLKTNNEGIIYFGDSVIKSIADTDTNRQSISELLETKLQKNIAKTSHGAYHLRIYEAFSKYIANSPYSKPELVIIPINMGSFSVYWENPMYIFEDDINLLSNDNSTFSLKTRFFSLFGIDKKTDPKRIEKWENKIVFYDTLPVGTVKSYSLNNSKKTKKDIAQYYIRRYLNKIDANHKKIKSLKSIINNFEKSGVKLLVYITPLDHGSGKFYVGNDFAEILNKNITIIEDTLKDSNTYYANLAFDLDKTYFDHSTEPDEHMDERGREYVAEELFKLLKQTK